MKISCFVLIYENIEIIKRSLSSIMEYSDMIDIHVAENPSEHTELFIKPVMLNLVKKGKIKSYTLFDKNIRSNAFISFFHSNHANVFDSDFLLVTDGDVVGEGRWLEEQLKVLKKYKDVFCCSLNMSFAGWSKGLIEIFPKEKFRNEDYIEIDSGMWLCLFRTSEYKKMFDFFCDNRLMIRDGPIKRFVSEYLKMKWVVARNSTGHELTRAGYSTPDYILKKKEMINLSGGNMTFWIHSDYSPFSFYTKDKHQRYPEPRCIIPRLESEKPSDDWIASELNSGNIKFPVLYFGINIKNIVKGAANIGNSDTLSFYDKDSNTLFIRCNLLKNRKYQDIIKSFETIFLYDTFYSFPEEKWTEIIKFSCKALIDGGEIRFTVRKTDDTFDDKIKSNENVIEKVTSILLINGFDLPTQTHYNPNVDLPGENRYSSRKIYYARKKQ